MPSFISAPRGDRSSYETLVLEILGMSDSASWVSILMTRLVPSGYQQLVQVRGIASQDLLHGCFKLRVLVLGVLMHDKSPPIWGPCWRPCFSETPTPREMRPSTRKPVDDLLSLRNLYCKIEKGVSKHQGL